MFPWFGPYAFSTPLYMEKVAAAAQKSALDIFEAKFCENIAWS
jgi:hypothetical protein